MITLQKYEADDIITGEEYIRSLYKHSDLSTYSDYDNTPLMWRPVKHVLGPCWRGRRFGDLLSGMRNNDEEQNLQCSTARVDNYYEMVLGDIPECEIEIAWDHDDPESGTRFLEQIWEQTDEKV